MNEDARFFLDFARDDLVSTISYLNVAVDYVDTEAEAEFVFNVKEKLDQVLFELEKEQFSSRRKIMDHLRGML